MFEPWNDEDDTCFFSSDADLEARTRPDQYEWTHPSDVNCYHQRNPEWEPGDDPDEKWLF